jgi:predicted PurR-regulated permease PerM
MGNLVGAIASGAAEVVGWLFFVLLVSYFILVESGGVPGRIINVNLPGFTADIRRMSVELGRIWNAFLRGQFLIIIITILVYSAVLTVLGVRYALGLALLAGFARFIPYVGPAIAWTTFGLVSYFQVTHPFGINPFLYTIIVVGTSLLMDGLLDNLVATRIMARALKIHPAAVLVAALILANLIGLVGVVLASPVVATLKLFLRYTVRKLFDQDPWAGFEEEETPAPPSKITLWFDRIWKNLVCRIKQSIHKS